ncbi:MAG: hypothetical protein KGI50_04640 [Patescibacteria group bacterium]|nr:hypothetical protein [Patescibacteria group bacterium]MDE2439255.1 hypothetical protein [Patescibacteria group bacterium]
MGDSLKISRGKVQKEINVALQDLRKEVGDSSLDDLRSGKYGTWCASDEHLDSFTFDDFMICVLFVLERCGVKIIENALTLHDTVQNILRRKEDSCVEKEFRKDFFGSSGLGGGYASDAECFFLHDVMGANPFRKLVRWEYGRGDLIFLGHFPYVATIGWDQFVAYGRRHVFPKLKRNANTKYILAISRVAQDILDRASTASFEELNI